MKNNEPRIVQAILQSPFYSKTFLKIKNLSGENLFDIAKNPGKYAKGLPITGIDDAEKQDDIVVFQAGTTQTDQGLETSGGRVLYVTALGKDLSDARAKAYKAIKSIKFKNMHYRTDIGNRA